MNFKNEKKLCYCDACEKDINKNSKSSRNTSTAHINKKILELRTMLLLKNLYLMTQTPTR